jgi:curved DNA-binding protein CbpA
MERAEGIVRRFSSSINLRDIIHTLTPLLPPRPDFYFYRLQDDHMALYLKNIACVSTPTVLRAHYATVSRHEWPSPSHPTRPLTPYQIMNIEPSAPYSKERFSNLVKIYHPDRCDHPENQACAHLPPEVRIERYHLIVAAHTILSDPDKRRAYDTFGVGWQNPQIPGSHSPSQPSYTRPVDPIHQNATWEDWERWRWEQYQREKNGGPSDPNFISHGTFAGGVMAFTLFAACVQQGYINGVSETRRGAIYERSYEAEQYMKRKKEETKARNKAGRIEDFVKQRDPATMAHPGVADMVLNQDTCAAYGIPKMDHELDLTRKFK